MFTPMAYFFALLNVADLSLTLLLIKRYQSNIEGNPIAHAFYSFGGPLGMAVFKTLTTAFVLGVAVYVYHRKPSRSYFILGLGCTILAFTLGYSLHLGLS